jgi:hypothetical protein
MLKSSTSNNFKPSLIFTTKPKDKPQSKITLKIAYLKKDNPLLFSTNHKPTLSVSDFPNIIKKRNCSYTEQQLLSTTRKFLLPSKRQDMLIPTGRTTAELMSQTYLNVANKLNKTKKISIKNNTSSGRNSFLRTKNTSYDFSTKRSDVASDAFISNNNSRTNTVKDINNVYNSQNNSGVNNNNKKTVIKQEPSAKPVAGVIENPEELHFIQVKFFQDNKLLASKFDY